MWHDSRVPDLTGGHDSITYKAKAVLALKSTTAHRQPLLRAMTTHTLPVSTHLHVRLRG
jgi:hypothetical protein